METEIGSKTKAYLASKRGAVRVTSVFSVRIRIPSDPLDLAGTRALGRVDVAEACWAR